MKEHEAPAIQPYRAAASTRLQALLDGGPLRPVRPVHFMVTHLRPAQLVITYAAIAVAMLVRAGWWVALFVGIVLSWYFGRRNDARTRLGVLRRTRIQLGIQLRTVTVPLAGWPFAGSDHALCLTAIEIEVDHDPAQLERAVRLGEPLAKLTFIADKLLRVEFPWASDPLGLERFDRLLFDILLTHADDLAIRHIRFRSPHEQLVADQPAQK